jgi:hypothetical protein
VTRLQCFAQASYGKRNQPLKRASKKKLPKMFGRYDEKFLPLQPLSERNQGGQFERRVL